MHEEKFTGHRQFRVFIKLVYRSEWVDDNTDF